MTFACLYVIVFPSIALPRVLSVVSLSLALLGACVDTAGRYDEFANRNPAGGTGGQGAGDAATGDGGCIAVAAVEGTYIFALSASLAPTKPIVSRVELVANAAGDALTFQNLQPLAASDRESPVGSPLTLGPFPVGASGVVSVDAPGLQVGGEANPITGADIQADVQFRLDLCGPREPFCGTVSGQVTQPLQADLTGSTYTLSPVAEGAGTPDPLPIDCAGNVADPL